MTNTGEIVREFRESQEVVGCPNGCEGSVSILSFTHTEPEDFYLSPGMNTRIRPVLQQWELSCGCILSGRSFTLVVKPEQLPCFVRNEDLEANHG